MIEKKSASNIAIVRTKNEAVPIIYTYDESEADNVEGNFYTGGMGYLARRIRSSTREQAASCAHDDPGGGFGHTDDLHDMPTMFAAGTTKKASQQLRGARQT